MGVDYSTLVVFGLRFDELKDDFVANGINIDSFIEDGYIYDLITNLNGYYDNDDYSNYILGGYKTICNEGHAVELKDFTSERQKCYADTIYNAKDSRYITFIKSMFEKYGVKTYLALQVM